MNRAALLFVLLVAACSGEPAPTASSDPSVKPTGPLAASIIVSDPGVLPAPNPARAAASSVAATVVYVSLPPGTLPDPAWVRILNLRTADAVTPVVVEGGFDPITIPATTGDTLDVAMTEGSGATSHTQVVAVRARPPRVVRTNPPKGQTDVPLNAVILIVISEPIDPATVNPDGIRLRLGADAVAGSLILDPGGTLVSFTPGSPLLPDTTYQLEVTQALTDLTGNPLEAAVTVPFSTAAPLPATQLVFTVQPSSIRIGGPITPSLRVTALDASNQVATGFTGTITLALGPNPGGASLSGTTTVAAVAGVAVFADLSIDGIGNGLFLLATASGLNGATSTAFDITQSLPSQLAFIVQPTTTGAGLILLPTVFVNVRDAFGKTIKGFTGTISLALGANPGGAVLSGTTTVAAGYDGAEFTDLRISQVGSGYTLVATTSGLTSATSRAFDITPTSQIAFASNRDGDWEIYLMNADGSGVTQLTDNPAVDGNPVWSPDGTRIAFTSYRDGNYEIYIMNADGSGVTRLTYDPAWDTDAAWSPDGRKIAFASDRGPTFDIYVMNADGSGVTRVTNGLARETEPTWSPDGARIAFTSLRYGYTEDEGYEVNVMNADGSGVTQLTNGQGGWQPAWSPDGSKIAFGNGRSVVGIYLMNTNGSAVTPLAFGVYGPVSWSPDGQKLACTGGSEDSSFVSICVMNADGSAADVNGKGGGGVSILTDRFSAAADPAWRPRPRP